MISKMIRYFFFFFLQNDPICYLRQLIFLEHIHPNPQMGKSVFLIAPRNVQCNWVLGRLYLNKRNNQYYQAKAFPFRPSHLKITKQIIYFPVILQVSPTKLTFTFMAEKFTQILIVGYAGYFLLILSCRGSKRRTGSFQDKERNRADMEKMLERESFLIFPSLHEA